MNDDLRSAQDDLAFLRGMVSDAPRHQSSSGWLFLIGGATYGVQCLFFWAHMAIGFQMSGPLWLLASFGPTVLFMVALTIVLIRNRKVVHGGVATRALNAAWSSTGLANTAIIAAFAFNAMREKSLLIWLLYPVVVCAIQGGGWYVAYMIRKRAWMGLTSAGWLLTAAVLGFMTRDIGLYCLTIGIGLLLFMALPGWFMIRQAAKETSAETAQQGAA